jgi:hypothetical protein
MLSIGLALFHLDRAYHIRMSNSFLDLTMAFNLSAYPRDHMSDDESCYLSIVIIKITHEYTILGNEQTAWLDVCRIRTRIYVRHVSRSVSSIVS